MRETITSLAGWPIRRNGQPILKSTHEAFLYAQLIFNDPKRQANLVFYRDDSYIKLRAERKKAQPNYQTMMDHAVRAQLFREALQETQRIKDEETKPEGG